MHEWLQARAHDSALLEAKLAEQQSTAALLHTESVLKAFLPSASTAQHSTVMNRGTRLYSVPALSAGKLRSTHALGCASIVANPLQQQGEARPSGR